MRLDEAFHALKIVQDFIPIGSSNRPGTPLKPSFITIHNTDNTSPGANAAAHARYVKGADARRREVSWHFTVDDIAVFQSLPTNEVGWHAGSGNAKSIAIEICMNADLDVAQAYERAALLTAVMAQQHGISVPRGIVQHNHWTGKHCPRVLRDQRDGWKKFLQRVEKIRKSLEAYPAELISMADGDSSCCEISAARRAPKKAERGTRAKSAAVPPRRQSRRGQVQA